jgi:hypothetical protein
MSGSEEWYLLTEVLRQPIGPNIVKYISTPRNTQEIEDPTRNAAEA